MEAKEYNFGGYRMAAANMKVTFLTGLAILILGIAGCGVKEKANPYFNATVLEVREKSVLVEPFSGEEELKSADQISVSLAVISSHEVPELEEGTQIRIVYNGEIAESYPAQVNTVFAIYLVDEAGEIKL